MLKILNYPDPKLQRVAKKVTKFDNRLHQIIKDMFETHYNTRNCAALAATQLDLPAPPHVTVIDFSEQKNQPLCLVNAEIIERQGTHKEEEGCMSVYPDYIHAGISRSETITVKYQDQEGNEQQLKTDGFLAKCIQHELEHLAGTIYIDHLSRLKRNLVDKKIQQVIKILNKNN
ncbi:MAG: peptide deformylase [Gammaproteobacteria bacterium]|nr:peptide deformylase [Gammaproteobacteria bacterium]